MSLTAKQEKFIECLLSGMTDRQAYITAYPGSEKWKPECIDVKACKLKKTDKVRLRLDKARAKVEAHTEITAERVALEISRLATYDMSLVYDEEGNAKPIMELPRDITAAITKVETYLDKEGIKRWRYTFANKDKSLQLLAQIKGMLQPKDTDTDKKPISISIDYGDKA